MSEKTICSKIFETSKKFPEKICLIHGEVTINYEDLVNSSLNLASKIIDTLSEPERCIAIAGPVGPDSIIAIMAILLSGHHYFWIDINQPLSFLEEQLISVNCPLILTSQSNAPQIYQLKLPTIQVIFDSKKNIHNLPKVFPTSAAYINFSSGSTGQPKAIVCTHAGVLRLCRHQSFLPFEKGLTFLFHSPLSFDAATLEIWGALLNGGCCVINGDIPLTPERLRDHINHNGVDTLWLTSSLFNAFVDLDITCFKGLNWLMSGGDVLSIKHVRQALQVHPQIQFINGYGPTENTTFTCCHRITTEDCYMEDIPIGQPITGTKIILCDSLGSPVARGEIGEIYALGEGLALGYLNQQELTNKVFIKLQHNGTYSRAYRTGDLARIDEKNNLRFVCRVDSEVKINGYRINITGLEARLREADDVYDCALLVIDNNGSKSLVAVLQAESSEKAKIIARKFATWEYPNSWLCIQKMPVTKHGKLDRAKLKALWLDEENNSSIGPLTELEKECSKWWLRLLGNPIKDAEKSFFDSGGTSLQAMQLLAICHSCRPQPSITLNDLRQHPTLRKFSALLQQRGVGIEALRHPIPDHTLVL